MAFALRVVLLAAVLVAVVPGMGVAQCLFMGRYQSLPPVSYSCAFGEIEWEIVDWVFEDLGGDQIGAIACPGPLPYLAGTLDCFSLTFELMGEGFGGCLQGYVLSGQVISPTQWTGVLSAGFTGVCYDCTSQDWYVSGVVGTGLPEPEQDRTWGTIKALYR